jgi:hypothetical protein
MYWIEVCTLITQPSPNIRNLCFSYNIIRAKKETDDMWKKILHGSLYAFWILVRASYATSHHFVIKIPAIAYHFLYF